MELFYTKCHLDSRVIRLGDGAGPDRIRVEDRTDFMLFHIFVHISAVERAGQDATAGPPPRTSRSAADLHAHVRTPMISSRYVYRRLAAS